MKKRLESDSIGTLEVPEKAYYGVQTLRASKNFNITQNHMNKNLIISLAQIKKAAAITNRDDDKLEVEKAKVIIKACDDIIEGKLDDEFIVDAIQGGAGTSANMNANEVIANRAIELIYGKKGDYSKIHPNDHVNMSQSTNDVFPTAGKLAVLKLTSSLITELERLHSSLIAKSVQFDSVLKMGRTQLQDAVPMKLGQAFSSYAAVIKRDIARVKKASDEMHTVNLGGTAIGTSINVSSYYLKNIIKNLEAVTGEKIEMADDLIDATQNLDGFVSVSSSLKSCAIDLSKMANDLRLLSSGPKTGIAEITLPAKQNGSSIMPGKINPVIAEVVSQIAFNVIGNDLTVTMAAESGQLELNAFEPVLFYKIFESIETLTSGVKTFVDNCITGIEANEERCSELLNSSVGITTALCPYLGYKESAIIAKKSLKTGVPILEIVVSEGLLPKEKAEKVLNPLSMTSANFEEEPLSTCAV